MRISSSIESASWISTRLHRLGQDVGSVIPEGFEAYARVFHPPYEQTTDGRQIPVRWQDIAAANDRNIQAEMRRLDLSCEPTQFSPTQEALWDGQPVTGSMPYDIVDRLVAILTPHTRTPESCLFAVWEGFGDLRIRENAGARVSNPHRNLFLLHGPIGDVRQTLSEVEWFYRSPNLWWPEDRAWCVATEIDFAWTYVGGSAACVQEILDAPELETLPTKPEQGNWMEK